MTVYSVDWFSPQRADVIGGADADHLIITAHGYLSLIDIVATGGGSYDGHFGTGYTNEGVYFTGIERFSFTDLAGVDQWITTGSGKDSILAGAGNDYVNGGAGVDTLDGGEGHDSLGADLTALGTSVNINLNRVSTPAGRSYSGFEAFWNLDTGAGNDIIVGHQTATAVDDIATGAGNDRITLYYGGAYDTVDGGAGSDRLIVHSLNYLSLSELSVNETGGYNGHFGTGYTGEGVYFTGIEHFTFFDYEARNTNMTTGAGQDSLVGGAGDDTFAGGAGNDSLLGGLGRDLLSGMSGNDLLNGGFGNDWLSGGGGKDTFVFAKIKDSSWRADYADMIDDFVSGSDKIDLSRIDASVEQTGNNSFTWRGTELFGTDAGGEVRFVRVNRAGTDNDRTFIHLDTDSDSASEMVIRLNGLHSLSQLDFML